MGISITRGGGAPGSSATGYKGQFATIAALNTAFPVGQPGWFAYVGPDEVRWNPVTLAWEPLQTATTTIDMRTQHDQSFIGNPLLT